MSQPVHLTLTPAVQADECSRIARTIAKVLRQRVFASDALAQCAAVEIATALIEQHGGELLYVPVRMRSATEGQRSSIADSLLLRAGADALTCGGRIPDGVLAAVATEHGVTKRTVARVWGQLRAKIS